MHLLELLSIILEAIICVLFAKSAMKNKPYLYGLTFTFAVYVVYDAARLYAWEAPNAVLPVAFFLATLTAMWSAWGLYKHA